MFADVSLFTDLDTRKHCYDMICSVQFLFIDFYQSGTYSVKPTAHLYLQFLALTNHINKTQ